MTNPGSQRNKVVENKNTKQGELMLGLTDILDFVQGLQPRRNYKGEYFTFLS